MSETGDAGPGGPPDEAEDARVLEERAARLARPLQRREDEEDRRELLVFSLARERFGIDAAVVVQVRVLSHLGRLPGAEPPVFGVTSWRGDLLTVLDLRGVLGLPERALTDLSRVVVVGRQAPVFGILADAVEDIRTVSASDVGPPARGVGSRKPFLLGLTRDALQVLDGDALIRTYT